MNTQLSEKVKVELMRKMLLIRLFEEKVADLYSEQEMRCPVHLSIGQEAAAIGMCQVLKPTDLLISGHRAHSHYLAKGGNTDRLLAEFYGKETGCCKGIGGSMHLVDEDAGFMFCTSIVGGSYPVAVGAALAKKQKKEESVTTLCLGDAGVEEGVFHECLNFASLHKLPMIFFCENNLYSVYTHLKVRQPERPIHHLAKGHGIKTFTANGNKVEDVYLTAQEAYEYASEGNGPAFIEVDTYRHREHCGPNFDNNIGYRTEEEFLEWKKKCPIEDYKSQLFSENILNQENYSNLERNVNLEIDQAVKFAKASPFPKPESLHSNLYAPNRGVN